MARRSLTFVNHVRKNGTRMWGDVLNPRRPQALAFWCDAQQQWTLAAAMFRVAPSAKPNTFGDLLQWHRHGTKGTWMTHLWMVKDPVAAWPPARRFAPSRPRGASPSPSTGPT